MANETKICVSIGNVPLDTISGILDQVEMAEIRLDLAGLKEEEIEMVFSRHDNLIATCREGNFNNDERASILESALKYGAAWIDVEADSDPAWRRRMIDLAKHYRRRVIVSMHYYTHTPPAGELRKVVGEMFEMGADVAKVASQVNRPSEAATLLGLYSDYKDLVAVGMGPLGVITRFASPFLGAPFTFASFGDNPLTAAGQVEYYHMAGVIERINSYY